MESRHEPPEKPAADTIACGMCKRRVPTHQTRTISGRLLCLGCLTAWYAADEDDDGS